MVTASSSHPPQCRGTSTALRWCTDPLTLESLRRGCHGARGGRGRLNVHVQSPRALPGFPLTVITQVCTVADAGAPDKEPVFASNFMPARGFADGE